MSGVLECHLCSRSRRLSLSEWWTPGSSHTWHSGNSFCATAVEDREGKEVTDWLNNWEKEFLFVLKQYHTDVSKWHIIFWSHRAVYASLMNIPHTYMSAWEGQTIVCFRAKEPLPVLVCVCVCVCECVFYCFCLQSQSTFYSQLLKKHHSNPDFMKNLWPE